MFRRVHCSTLAAALALLGALATTPAFAGDVKVYPGSGCQPIFEIYEDSGATTRLTRFNGALRNVGSKTDGIDCPIVRDREATTKGFTATVRVKHTSGRLNVAIHSRDAFGKFVDVAAGSITDPGEQELTLLVEQSVPEGMYTLGLNLPVNAEIVSYTIDELP